MKEWAKREVEIACRKENPNRKEGEFDYGCACYESALKAFNSLLEDGHSGFSISMTKHILNRLIDGKPLTPIEDSDDIWNYVFCREDGTKVYQCKRMSALFKRIHPDGEITYSDNDRFYSVNIKDPDASYYSGLVDDVMSELYPIEMPYMPSDKAIKVVCDDFLMDSKNGDYDTVGILYGFDPTGEKVQIGRYFKAGENDMIEITADEYNERRKLSIEKGLS